MRAFAERFYKSKRWQATAKEYAKSVGRICESCAAKGDVVPGVIVHHIVELTPENIHNPSITLSWNNLELVCRVCHAARHPKEVQKRKHRRYVVDAQGHVIAREVSPPVSSEGTPGKTGK